MESDNSERAFRTVGHLQELRDHLVQLSLLLKDYQFEIDQRRRKIALDIASQALTAARQKGRKDDENQP